MKPPTSPVPSEPWSRPGIDMIVLVGFMAAGKTTVGRILADRLGWTFVDFDERIRARVGRSPGDIIRQDGEAAFRSREAQLTADLAGRKRLVLAPGGGWGADPRRADALGPGAVRVWLRITAEEAVRRADAEGVDRPLLGEGPDRVARARDLLVERASGYAAAEIVLDVDGRSPEVVTEEIFRRLEAYSGGR